MFGNAFSNVESFEYVERVNNAEMVLPICAIHSFAIETKDIFIVSN